MRKSTIIGCFLGLLSLTLSAQSTQTSSSKTTSGTTIEVQQKSTATIQELLTRYANVGNQSGSISDYFSKEEQQMLHSYFSNQRPANSNQVANGVSKKNAVKATSIKDVYGETATKAQYTPLFLAPTVLTAENEAEILAAAQSKFASNEANFTTTQGRGILSNIIPNAGATESFAVATGDFFYDPTDGTNGGPGGDCTTTGSGNPGDYPNCGCVTTTTLTGSGLSVEFLSFNIFGNFDWLNIYDGPDTSSPQIYDSTLNANTDTLAGMIAANGSGVFNATSGALTFEFNATAVVNTCGWEVEVLSAGGGGGGGCTPDNLDTLFAGGNGGAAGGAVYFDITVGAEDINIETFDMNTASTTAFNMNVYVFEGTYVGNQANAALWGAAVAVGSGTGAGVGLPSTATLDVPVTMSAGTTYAIALVFDGTAAHTYTNGDGTNQNYSNADITIDLGSASNVPFTAPIFDPRIWNGSVGYCVDTGGGGGCTPDSLDTLFAGGNGGAAGGAVYFDITVGAEDINIETFDMNTASTTAFNMDVYVFEGTYVGNQANAALWGAAVAVGSGTGAGVGLPSTAILDVPVAMSAGTTYAVALVFDGTAAHTYTNGNGTNQNYSNADITIDLGSASNVPFTAPIFDPRIWNGSVGYCVGTGGGGGGTACSQADASNAFENGYGNTNNTVEIADEIIVAADTDFELNQLTINMINNGGFNSIDVAVYADAGGMPGAMVGSVMTIVPTSSTAIGVAFGRDVLEIVLDIAPGVMLNGTAGSETVYWIGVETPNPVDPASDAYWETTSIPNTGTDYRVHYDVANGGWTATLPADDMWNTVYTASGECTPMGGTGGGGLTTVYGVNNANQDLIGFGVTTPGTTEVFGTSPVTVNFENAGAIDPANPTTGYALDNGGQFYSFDVISGFYTLLGNIPGDWIGMEFDRSSGTLYAIAGATLYTIDPVAVTATMVGAMGIPAADLPIALAIDGAGVGYTYEIVTDNLYSIDLATAATTLIGNIGFDANFGQGMCYDPTTDMVYMSAFNGGAFAAEWRSVDTATGATTLIGAIVTPAATTQVAWSSIGETPAPPACPEPTNLVVSNIAPDSADLSWTAEPNASSGYIWSVFVAGDNPITGTPVATGTTPAGTTTATATGLTGGGSYDFYVVADCDADGLSQLAGPISFATPPACGGKFYDTGGPGGDYENDANVTTVISPANAGDQVTVTFTAFEVEASWDALYVYDGPDASAPIISSGNPATTSGFPAGGYYGTTNPGPFTSSHPSGALTFVFLSDASVPQAGWEADVTCAPTPPPNDMIVNSIDVDQVSGFPPYTDPQVNMPAATTEDGNPAGCDLTGANGVWYNFVAFQDGTANATIVTPGGASSVTFYTAPNENAVETDLTLVAQNSNQCAPGTSASIVTEGGQAYYVFVLNSGAVTDIVIDGTNLGVADNTIAGFSYYPNPTNGVLNLNSIDNIDTISMYNLLGQLVIENQVNATASQVDISGLSTGTYIMKVTVNGQIGTYKVLKQ